MTYNSGPEIKRMLGEGHSQAYIAVKLKVASSTVAYHKKVIEEHGKGVADDDMIVMYDWTAIQAFLDAGHTVPQAKNKFKVSGIHWKQGKLLGLVSVHRGRKLIEKHVKQVPLSNELFFTAGNTHDRKVVKERILKDKLLPYECATEGCAVNGVIVDGVPVWNGRLISLHLDHTNGVRDDHRIENLRFLCPNCHSQTDSWCGRNTRLQKSKRGSEGTVH